MTQYNIKRWNVVMFGNSNTKVPMIYIKPDLAFLEFARKNSFAVMVNVSGTDTIYDGKNIPGIVYKSSNVPNSRPNYFEKTGYYVVTLDANWYGYPHPNKLGTVSFTGLKQIAPNPEDNKPEHALKYSRALSNNQTGLDIVQIVAIIALIISLFGIILLIAKRK